MPAPPRFDIVRVNPQGGAVLAGRAAPGAEVILRSNGREIGRTRADAQGQWVFTTGPPLAPGGQEITVAFVSGSGGEVVGDGPVLVVVPERVAPGGAPPGRLAQAIPSAGPAPASPAGTTAPIVVMTAPQAAPRLLQGPGLLQDPGSVGTAGRAGLGLEIVDYDAAGEIRFAGIGSGAGAVRLYIDDVFIGDAEAGADGRWTLTPRTRVPEGNHRLRLDQIDPAGRVTARLELPFQRAAVVTLDGRDNLVVVQPRQNLWRIARRAYGQGVRYTEIYAANRDLISDPNRIFPGQVFAIPADASTPAASSRSR